VQHDDRAFGGAVSALGLCRTHSACGLPGARATDVVYATCGIGHEVTRYRRCSSDDVVAGRAIGATDEYWRPTPEPQHRISQLYMEPVLRELPVCNFRPGWQFLDLAQDAHGVDIRAVELASGREQRLRTQ
jgi:hypothetical protein